MTDKANQEASQDESGQDGMPLMLAPRMPDAFFEEARKREAQLEARLRRIERALGLPEEA